MHTRQLEAFIVVAEELHFGRAAERLHVSQPALSRQIDQLERELGAPLLRRDRRRVELTEAGAGYLGELRRALSQLQRAAETARGLSTGELGTLRIGHVDSFAYDLLPRGLRRYRVERPDIGIALMETHSAAIADGLRNGELDVGLIRASAADEHVDDVLLLEEAFVAALPDDHPAVVHESIHPSVLADDPFVIVERRSAPVVHDRVLELCREAGFSPSIAYEAAPLNSTLPFVGAALASAIVPLGVSRHLSVPGVSYVHLEGGLIALELRAAWRRGDESPPVRRFVEILQEVAAGIGPSR